MPSYLADRKPVINLVLKGTHLDFPDKLRLDHRFSHNEWH